MAGANPLGIIEGLLEVEGKIGSFIKGDIGGDSAVVNHFRDQYRASCEEFSNAPGWLQNFPGFKAAGTIGRICKPYLDDNQWDSPELGPPFTGGQCQKQYDVTATGFFTSSSQCTNPEVGGTQQSIFMEFACDSPFSFRRVFGPVGAPRLVAQQGDGLFSIRFSGFNSSGEPTDFVIANNHCPAKGDWQVNLSVTPCDGDDDCGDPEPVPLPGPNPAPMPDPIRLPGDEPRPNPRNPDGLPDIPVDPFPDPIGGDGFPALPDGFGFGGGRSGGGGAGRSFDPIENDDETGGQDEEFDDPPEGEVWVGAYLELTQVPINITTVPGTGPENGAYFRIVGNFSIFSDSESSRLYSDSVQVRNRWTKFIGNPQGLPVSGARVSVLPGVRYRVIPVSAPADPNRNGEE